MFWRVLTTVVLLSPLASASSFNTQHLRVSAMNGIGLGAQGVPDADELQTVADFAAANLGAQSNTLEAFSAGRIVQSAIADTPGDKEYTLHMQMEGNLGTTKLMTVQVSEAKADGSKALTSARTEFSLRFAPPPDCSQKDAACDDPAQQGMVGAYMPNTGDSVEVRNAAVELCRGQDGLAEGSQLMVCKVSTQVVNGINYKFLIGTNDSCDGDTFSGKVYASFSGEYQVSSNR